MDNLVDELMTLFEATTKAHYEVYAASNGDDPEWPTWYAEYLLDKLPMLLGAPLTKDVVVDLLVRLSKEHALQSPDMPWPRYYAQVLVERYT